MPRISPSILRAAHSTSPNLARLLPVCRDLESAENELRWLGEHASATAPTNRAAAHRLKAMCERRRSGVPLQYILGSQPFGDLDIKCASGVLIPRPETEAYTVHLARLLKTGHHLPRTTTATRAPEQRPPLRIVDLCTGTGCIPLLLYSLLSPSFPALDIHGVDISPRALSLSRQNLHSALSRSQVPPPSPGRSIAFHHGDILSTSWRHEVLPGLIPRCDVLVSNPPYISPASWRFGRDELSYSTRKFEPKLALVPRRVSDLPRGCRSEDVFYAALLDIARVLEPSTALFEFGDAAQGRRILQLALEHPFSRDAELELWRDYPDLENPGDGGVGAETSIHVVDQSGKGRVIPLRGCGNIRSIVVRKSKPRTA
ncbi:related to MTQ1 - putative methyltransferase [Cephalotrichum gorgonifer]|uniref:Related to MTQ1 - putative methyltransferase n=1 Tax=Cephalotrichum gorgonifer TaxID=2041049 RepID=A0AAE8STJ5_9PEZI|nr:related to MTQ1 - putative methyltransferase [Cephalotrichum gorgonifer]